MREFMKKYIFSMIALTVVCMVGFSVARSYFDEPAMLQRGGVILLCVLLMWHGTLLVYHMTGYVESSLEDLEKTKKDMDFLKSELDEELKQNRAHCAELERKIDLLFNDLGEKDKVS